MALKPRHKRRIAWSITVAVATLILAVIIVPPMITLNRFKPAIENAVYAQTDVPAKLNGDLTFSLLGGATIVAHDVSVPNTKIGTVLFSIPFRDLFNLNNIELERTVVVYDANINIPKLAPADFNHNIIIHNSIINFMDKHFHIIRGEFSDGKFRGIVRTHEHKYDVEFSGDTFFIKNKNNRLTITGQIFSDGSVRGHMDLETYDIGSWIGFGFSVLPITALIKVSTDFEWDGKNGYKYSNIIANKFTGDIQILPDGYKNIRVRSKTIDYDYSFLINKTSLMYNATIDLDFYGKIRIGGRTFNHILLDTVGEINGYKINKIVGDDITLTGGHIDADGAHNVLVSMPIDGVNTTCLLTGNNSSWRCAKYTYGDISGTLSVSGDAFEIFLNSKKTIPSFGELNKMIQKLGKRGRIHFNFADMAGTYEISPDHTSSTYKFADNKTLSWANLDLPFIPSAMQDTVGNFIWNDKTLEFVPHSNKWKLTTSGNKFTIHGKSIRDWTDNIDIRFANDGAYTISGTYDNKRISNLKIVFKNHEFTGSVSGKNITLKTNILNLDSFVSQEYLDNIAEMEFFTNSPILILFDIKTNVFLTADRLIYNGEEYENFVYSLKDDTQTFSITDGARGNLLATIAKEKTNYDIFVQLNRFRIAGTLLSSTMPLNIRDSVITAEIHLTTNGKITHDINYNMTGAMDLTFDGGYLVGMSFDDFYASANDITILNSEYAISNALKTGETKIKKLRIVAKYSNGTFETTQPFTLSMRHVDAIGALKITNGNMFVAMDLTLRGTAPTPAPIKLNISPNGTRQYSLSDIIRNFDAEYMRQFIKTHDKF